jgi:hypothetical protein
MADKNAADDQLDESVSPAADGQDDTEGHLIMPNIASARAMTSGRMQDTHRNQRVRGREKDERPGEKRGR